MGGCLEVGGVWRGGVWRWGEVWRCEGLEVEVWRSGGGRSEQRNCGNMIMREMYIFQKIFFETFVKN